MPDYVGWLVQPMARYQKNRPQVFFLNTDTPLAEPYMQEASFPSPSYVLLLQ